ncbi:MAG: 5-(carboxyamino)imidazole ribonucleotide mutase, partial [Methanobrevibacter sp.]|nr:5-(carboxyamino)imidazole ribonucleotide mutase [Methanobrevibacter sp.]
KDEEKLLSSLNGEYFNKEFIDDLSFEDENKEEVSAIELEKSEKSPLVSIIAGSDSDMEIATKACEVLNNLNINYDINILSPIRFPAKFEKYIQSVKDVELFLAVSGLSAHVTGSIVALSEKPVIGVPCSSQINGRNSLLAMVNMPPGVPVATVGVDNGGNAGILAAEILALSNKEIESHLKKSKHTVDDLK